MRNKYSLTLWMFILALFVCSAACRQGAATTGKKQAVETDWKEVDLKQLSLRIPERWVWAGPLIIKARGERGWKLTPPNLADVPPGSYPKTVSIWETLDGKEKRSLEKISIDQTKGLKYRAMVGKPKPLKVKGGKCLAYNEEGRTGNQCGGSLNAHGGGPEMACISATIKAVCYADSGNHFQIMSTLGVYHERGKPDKETVVYAKVFEKILASIEFK